MCFPMRSHPLRVSCKTVSDRLREECGLTSWLPARFPHTPDDLIQPHEQYIYSLDLTCRISTRAILLGFFVHSLTRPSDPPVMTSPLGKVDTAHTDWQGCSSVSDNRPSSARQKWS